jgi:hypothetical protein
MNEGGTHIAPDGRNKRRSSPREFLRRAYDPCVLCWRRARRGGFLLCRRCARNYSSTFGASK